MGKDRQGPRKAQKEEVQSSAMSVHPPKSPDFSVSGLWPAKGDDRSGPRAMSGRSGEG